MKNRKFQQYIISQINKIKCGLTLKKDELLDGIIIFSYWLIPSTLFALLQRIENHKIPALYIKEAIDEGIGPHIWNIFGSIGFFFFGLTIISPKFKFFRISTSNILMNTYAMGALSMGLMFGNLVILLENSKLILWDNILLAISFFISFIHIFLLNFFIWYCAKIINKENQEDNLAYLLDKVDLKFRLSIGLFIATFPIFLLIHFEK